jgi:urate oxidase
MRKLFIVGVVAAIALASCQAGIQNQIKGKWQQTFENSKQVCTEEYLEKYMTTTCILGTETLFTVTSSYEIVEGDRIVFTSSKGVKDVVGVKIIGDQMEQKLSNGNSVKLIRLK